MKKILVFNLNDKNQVKVTSIADDLLLNTTTTTNNLKQILPLNLNQSPTTMESIEYDDNDKDGDYVLDTDEDDDDDDYEKSNDSFESKVTTKTTSTEITTTKPRKRCRLTHLTAEEKLMRRKMKNRIAAQNARDRKKVKMDSLEKVVKDLEAENKKLQNENKKLKEQTKLLSEENIQLKLTIKQQQPQQQQQSLTQNGKRRRIDASVDVNNKADESAEEATLLSKSTKAFSTIHSLLGNEFCSTINANSFSKQNGIESKNNNKRIKSIEYCKNDKINQINKTKATEKAKVETSNEFNCIKEQQQQFESFTIITNPIETTTTTTIQENGCFINETTDAHAAIINEAEFLLSLIPTPSPSIPEIETSPSSTIIDNDENMESLINDIMALEEEINKNQNSMIMCNQDELKSFDNNNNNNNNNNTVAENENENDFVWSADDFESMLNCSAIDFNTTQTTFYNNGLNNNLESIFL